MYLDGGMDIVKPYILGFIKDAVKREVNFKDNKSLLQEEIQKQKGNVLLYEEVGESGPDHDKIFNFVVKLNGEIVGEGSGRTKKEAEQAAAGDALVKLKK
jgi:ribonuclease-3